MTRKQFALTLSVVILSFFQPVLAQDSAEEGKVVSQVRLRDFEGAWSEDQVRKWATGPAKQWLDKTNLFFSMMKLESWVRRGEVGDRLVEATRATFEATKAHIETLRMNLKTLSLQPYNLSATVWSHNFIDILQEAVEDLAALGDDPNFTGGPSIELAIELKDHRIEGIHLLTDLTPHVGAVVNWYGAAVTPPRW